MANLYSSLLPPHGQLLEEAKTTFQFLTERHLQAAWLEQKYFNALQTASGQALRVISPGIWNQNAGPDFLKAHLCIGNVEIHGDIEIHLSANDWYHHGHHRDCRYNQVALHVSLWNPKRSKPIVSENGKEIPQVFLEGHLTCPPAKLIHLIDLDLYPYQTFLGSGKCARALFQDLPEGEIVRLFQSAAAWRLLQKSRTLQYRVDDPSLSLIGGMAMALGYKHNAETFLQLFLWLHPLRHLGEEALLALALGACGIFEQAYQAKWGSSEVYQRLHALYLMHALTRPIPQQFPLITHQTRPFNHPVRRLACLVKMIGDESLHGLYSRLKNLWHRKGSGIKLKAELLECLPSYQDPYWGTHFLFEKEAQPQALPLIGASLKQEMLVNAFLPLLYQEIAERSDPEEEALFKEFYNTITAAGNSKSRYLIHRFFGQSSKKQLLNRADTEQGAFQLHRDFCLHYEASCEGCPFVDNYKKTFKSV